MSLIFWDIPAHLNLMKPGDEYWNLLYSTIKGPSSESFEAWKQHRLRELRQELGISEDDPECLLAPPIPKSS